MKKNKHSETITGKKQRIYCFPVTIICALRDSFIYVCVYTVDNDFIIFELIYRN